MLASVMTLSSAAGRTSPAPLWKEEDEEEAGGAHGDDDACFVSCFDIGFRRTGWFRRTGQRGQLLGTQSELRRPSSKGVNARPLPVRKQHPVSGQTRKPPFRLGAATRSLPGLSTPQHF